VVEAADVVEAAEVVEADVVTTVTLVTVVVCAPIGILGPASMTVIPGLGRVTGNCISGNNKSNKATLSLEQLPIHLQPQSNTAVIVIC